MSNLGHNADVWYDDTQYITDDGGQFCHEEVWLSDGGDNVVKLIPNEALELLAWLQQEKTKLERLAKEQA